MNKFQVVEMVAEPNPEWAVEWTAGRGEAVVIKRRFDNAEDAQRWADRLNEVEADGRPLPPD